MDDINGIPVVDTNKADDTVGSDTVIDAVIEQPKESKNKRRRRKRSGAVVDVENDTGSDNDDVPNAAPPVFNVKVEEPKPKRPKKVTKREQIEAAKENTNFVSAVLNQYFSLRGVPSPDALGTILNAGKPVSITDAVGNVYYTTLDGALVSGPLPEAIAFHGSVVAGSGAGKLEAWLEAHPVVTSTLILAALAGYTELQIRGVQAMVAKAQNAARNATESPSTSDPTPPVSL